MFTVILYWDTHKEDGIDLETYDFLFSCTWLQKCLITRKYAGNLKQLVAELNELMAHLHDWRLILFDGRLISPDKMNAPDIIRKEWNELLFFFSGCKVLSQENSLDCYPPCEIWYLSCWEKNLFRCQNGINFAHAKMLLNQTEHGKILEKESQSDILIKDILDIISVPCFRMCWMELKCGMGMQHWQEEIRVCFVLLILAGNQISSLYLNSGYLYRIKIKIDHGLLMEYISKFKNLNQEMKKKLREAECDYLETERHREGYINPGRLSKVQEYSDRMPEDHARFKLRIEDLRPEKKIDLKNKLYENERWLNKQLYVSNNTLSDSVTWTQKTDMLNGKQLLDEAGQANIRNHLRSAVHSICIKKEEDHNPLKTEKEFEKRTERISHRAETQLTKAEYKFAKLTIAVTEGIAGSVFLIRIVKLWIKKVVDYCLAYTGLSSAVSLKSIEMLTYLLAFFGSVIFITSMIYWVLKIITLIGNGWACFKYNRYTDKIFKKLQNQRKNMDEIREEIAQYQYHWILYERQEEIRKDMEEEKKYLQRHKIMHRNLEEICDRLEQMPGEDVQLPSASFLLPDIDFHQSPENVQYYWNLFHENRINENPNGIGDKIDVVFGFVSGIEIHRVSELEIAELHGR